MSPPRVHAQFLSLLAPAIHPGSNVLDVGVGARVKLLNCRAAGS